MAPPQVSGTSMTDVPPDEAFARTLDEQDPLRGYRDRFHIPCRPNGEPVLYFCGNSLGLQPKAARAIVEQELEDWATLGVDAHFRGKTPWYSYHEVFRETGARLVGARPGEVVMMNGLTTNLHLMMVSFYRPTTTRFRVLMESPAFPSDIYAIRTHVRTRGYDPDEAVITLRPRDGEHTLRTEDVEAALAEHGDSIALVLIGGVNFFTGQVMDMARITDAGHAQGCLVGFDLAHAAGNIPLALHDWNVDFACWCSYKYLNSGPGGIAGCFVHERHATNVELPRYGGWWGNDPSTRFRMHLNEEFVPKPDADAWQLSNPPILAMAPLQASMAIFDEVGMDRLRAKSQRLTPYLRALIEREPREWFEIITPRAPDASGCQLSILVHDRPRERFAALEAAGVVGDFREPNVIRVAPVPLYNSFHDVWRFVRVLAELK
ncbi:MAG: kynureninase [Phycisphaerales bacterium]|nr:kynureninase [Phycisphaerales bacterium]